MARLIYKVDLYTLGKSIEDLILEFGYKSVTDFHTRSAQFSLSRSQLYKIVSGKEEPSLSSLVTIAKALDLPEKVLFSKLDIVVKPL